MVGDAAGHLETRRAFQRHVQDFSPDDFYAITRHVRQTIGQMAVGEILAYLRLSHHDSHLFALSLPRLTELAVGLDRDEHRGVRDAIDRVWDLHFPLGEEDLADAIARLLYAMDDYQGALDFFARSRKICGPDAGTLSNMAACHQLLGQAEKAKALLQEVLALDPADPRAQELMSLIGNS
jgi:tetratricopeptide (TPR) repeat protein